ncbi:MAG: hypothetical protein LBH29_03890 [Elusimicrobiota bacterium]|nr:hypothetical protein [Elusimicrobiota bacterium]
MRNRCICSWNAEESPNFTLAADFVRNANTAAEKTAAGNSCSMRIQRCEQRRLGWKRLGYPFAEGKATL